MTFLDAHRPLEDYFGVLEDAACPSSGCARSPTRPRILTRARFAPRIPLFLHIRAITRGVSSDG